MEPSVSLKEYIEMRLAERDKALVLQADISSRYAVLAIVISIANSLVSVLVAIYLKAH